MNTFMWGTGIAGAFVMLLIYVGIIQERRRWKQYTFTKEETDLAMRQDMALFYDDNEQL